jgi:hypothetical protein
VADWIWFVLAALAAVGVGTVLAYALAAPGGRPRRRDPQSTGKTRYELDNAVLWNPWPIAIAAAVVAALVALIVLVGDG